MYTVLKENKIAVRDFADLNPTPRKAVKVDEGLMEIVKGLLRRDIRSSSGASKSSRDKEESPSRG